MLFQDSWTIRDIKVMKISVSFKFSVKTQLFGACDVTKQNNISSFEQMDADDFCVATARITYPYPDTPTSIMHSKR